MRAVPKLKPTVSKEPSDAFSQSKNPLSTGVNGFTEGEQCKALGFAFFQSTIGTMRRVAHLGLVALAASISLSAQSIQYDSARKIWLLGSATSSYAMGLGRDGQLQHLYWGGPLWRLEDVPAAVTHEDISSFDPHEMLDNEEYPGWGGPRYYEAALKITRADGDRDLVSAMPRITSKADRLNNRFERH